MNDVEQYLYQPTSPHDDITQKNTIWNFTVLYTSYL